MRLLSLDRRRHRRHSNARENARLSLAPECRWETENLKASQSCMPSTVVVAALDLAIPERATETRLAPSVRAQPERILEIHLRIALVALITAAWWQQLVLVTSPSAVRER